MSKGWTSQGWSATEVPPARRGCARTVVAVGLIAMAIVLTVGARPASASNWWRPKLGTSWQWQLSGKVNTPVNAKVYDLDYQTTSKSTVRKLHRTGRRVVCNVEVGGWEPAQRVRQRHRLLIDGG